MSANIKILLASHSIQSIVEGCCWWKFIYILLDLARNSCEKCNFWSLAGIEPVIPVQRSNQLSYRGQLSSSNHKLMYICIYIQSADMRSTPRQCSLVHVYRYVIHSCLYHMSLLSPRHVVQTKTATHPDMRRV